MTEAQIARARELIALMRIPQPTAQSTLYPIAMLAAEAPTLLEAAMDEINRLRRRLNDAMCECENYAVDACPWCRSKEGP